MQVFCFFVAALVFIATIIATICQSLGAIIVEVFFSDKGLWAKI